MSKYHAMIITVPETRFLQENGFLTVKKMNKSVQKRYQGMNGSVQKI
jgi:hypothetical protein